MSLTQDHDGGPVLAPGAAEVLQAATRMLAGVALRSLDALDAAVTLPQFRLLAVLAGRGPVPTGQAARTLGLDPCRAGATTRPFGMNFSPPVDGARIRPR